MKKESGVAGVQELQNGSSAPDFVRHPVHRYRKKSRVTQAKDYSVG